MLEYLAGGMSEQQILTDFPDLTRDDIRAVLAFAAARATSPHELRGVTLLFDANLSPSLVSRLRAAFPDSRHVRDVGLREASDEQIWAHAKASGYVIVSEGSRFPGAQLVEGARQGCWLPADTGQWTLARTMRRGPALHF